MTRQTYRNMSDIGLAHYFAFPPQGEHYTEMAPDGSMMTIIACKIESKPAKLGEAPVMESADYRVLHARHKNQRDTPEGRDALIDNDRAFRSMGRALPDLLAQRNAPKPPQRPKAAKKFRASDVATRPHEYFTQADVEEIRERAAHVLIDLCRIAEFLPFDKQVQPKLADRLRELFEREIDSTTNYGLRLAEELKVLRRASLQSEIDFSNTAQKERQLHYLRSQLFLLHRMEEGVLAGYEQVMAEYANEHGVWHGYKTIGHRARRWKKGRVEEMKRIGETERMKMLDQLGPLAFAKWIKELKKVSPSNFKGGVDQAEPGLTPRMQADPNWQEIETGGYHEYGAYDNDWPYDDRD